MHVLLWAIEKKTNINTGASSLTLSFRSLIIIIIRIIRILIIRIAFILRYLYFRVCSSRATRRQGGAAEPRRTCLTNEEHRLIHGAAIWQHAEGHDAEENDFANSVMSTPFRIWYHTYKNIYTYRYLYTYVLWFDFVFFFNQYYQNQKFI